MFKLNDNVVEINKPFPRKGTVVEVGTENSPKFAGRVRVLWLNKNGTPDKRTWVAPKTLQYRSPVVEISGN